MWRDVAALRSRWPGGAACPSPPAQGTAGLASLRLPGAGSVSANGVALFSLLPWHLPSAGFLACSFGEDWHPREDGDSLAGPWFYGSILRACRPSRTARGQAGGMRGWGHLWVFSRTAEGGTSLPRGSCGSGLDSSKWVSGCQTTVTAEPESHQNETFGRSCSGPGPSSPPPPGSTSGRKTSHESRRAAGSGVCCGGRREVASSPYSPLPRSRLPALAPQVQQSPGPLCSQLP